MKILLWHGYLLTGSGSNVYTANLARAWRSLGHDVTILCQERHPEALSFVDEAGDFAADNRSYTTHPNPTLDRSTGRCRLLRPAIDGLLPVYVYDEYEGFRVKTFVDLSDAELDSYTERNVQALVKAIDELEPEAIITGHEVMGPYIASRACARTATSFIAKLHGSALEYAVKKQSRYERYASVGLSAATHVVGGSDYMVREALRVIPGWRNQAVVVNPGCDVSLFKPDPGAKTGGMVGFVGKLIASKGVHHLLAALPLVESLTGATIVGYGAFEQGLRVLADAMSNGDLETMRSVALRGENGRLVDLADFLEEVPGGYLERSREVHIEFTGRLEHDRLSQLLPSFDVLGVPSVVPEAFGMVAAEAAAAGVLPVVPDHSGIAEAGAAIEEAIGRPGVLTFSAADPVRDLARSLERVLGMPRGDRSEAERIAVSLATERWSWDRVADRLLEVATASA